MESPDHGILPDLPPVTQDDISKVPSIGERSEDGGDSCRICRGEATEEQPLFYPCKCSGSIRFVHQDCLMEWLAHSKKKYCELCKTPFRFTKLYDKSMPVVLPFPLFLRQVSYHLFEGTIRWTRYVFVAAIWFMCLPWCIRQVWRGLFWLGDGSWLSEAEYRRSSVQRLNKTLTDLKHINTTVAGRGVGEVDATFLSLLLNSTTSKRHEQDTSNGSLVSMLLRFLSGESLVSKIFRILFSIPPLHFERSTNTNQTQPYIRRPFLQRGSSLLSEVGVIKALAPSLMLNHLMLDVMEGILICLALVAAFILIFLIREWVINQQPMLNMPDPDAAENPPAPLPANGRPIIRPRRRRIVPRMGNLPAQPGENLEQPETDRFPPLRRAMTEDNIVLPSVADFERPDFRARSQSLANLQTGFEGDASGALARGAESPPPLLRGAIGDAVNVHRAIEEAPIAVDGREVHPSLLKNGTELIPSADRLEDINQIPAGPLRRPSTPVVHFEPEVEVIGDASGSLSSMVAEGGGAQLSSDSDQDFIPTPVSSDDDNAGDNVAAAAAQSPTAGEGTETQSADVENEADNLEENNVEADSATDPDESPEADQPAVQHPGSSALNSVADWLWKVDGPVPAVSPLELHDDVHVVEALEAEAPFVPANPEAILAQEGILPFPANAANPAAIGQPPNAPANIDWNDPNVQDEIEDLEGVLELIGMEGPIVGMLQNVIFSMFLITVTLAGSVWVPYIWGKITLLLIANPVVVLIKAPTFLISNLADLIADIVFFALGIAGLLFNSLTKTVKAVTSFIFPSFSNLLNTELFEELSLNVTHQSGTRLEKTLTSTILTLNPDLPTFSIQSHRALIGLKQSLTKVCVGVFIAGVDVYQNLSWPDFTRKAAFGWLGNLGNLLSSVPAQLVTFSQNAWWSTKGAFNVELKPLAHDSMILDNIELVDWNTQDKIIAIFLGYVAVGIMCYIFLKGAHLILGLKKDEKVEGSVADVLRQCGGVLKVIVIIGIEMIIFPLYCGLLLDLALLPLFEGATVRTRLAFIARAPFTGLFLHWFVGTCYMFHFALFVSICRKILRKGVLYFIRDPDDPTFHPVRDVLERPVPTQLGKIAFSALVYGGLVIMCLGGVVWGLGRIDGVLPIRWSTPEPRLAFPVDVIFYNFMLPFIIRKVEPSKKVSAVYEWWFRGCAHGLRLTQFLFGDERAEERMTRSPWLRTVTGGKDGTYMRVPASDSCRIPKDKKVFLEVSEANERLDGQPDKEKGLHGKSDDRWTKVYLPPQFKARIATFVVLLWLFAAGTGVASTIGPLLIGRAAVKWMAGSRGRVNDLYAFTMGIHLLGAFAYAIANLRRLSSWLSKKPVEAFSDFRRTLYRVWPQVRYVAGIFYLTFSFGIFFPLILSLVAELYIHIPLFTLLLSSEQKNAETAANTNSPSISFPRFPPTIFLLQTWTLGLLYLRLAFRIALNYPCQHTRLAAAIRTVFRDGYTKPDVRLASRAIIVPLTGLCIVLLGAPILYARAIITLTRTTDAETVMRMYRMGYPGLLFIAVTAYMMVTMKRKLEVWRVKIRDEVYLVGERLHNYVDRKERKRLRKEKGKEKAA